MQTKKSAWCLMLTLMASACAVDSISPEDVESEAEELRAPPGPTDPNPCIAALCPVGTQCVPKAGEAICRPIPIDRCPTILCPTGTHCEVNRCVPNVPKVFCGGFAGIPCPGAAKCIDDPSDDCDPKNGGADCGGMCICKSVSVCPPGSVWNSSPSVCACVPVGGPKCGQNTCGAGQYCCNASCGICAPFGAACIQIACEAAAE